MPASRAPERNSRLSRFRPVGRRPRDPQIEPEATAGALTQGVDDPEGSVERRPSGPDRQNGVFSPVPAPENTPSEARVEWGGSEGEGDASTRGAQAAPEWVAAVPVPVRREEAKVSQNEPEDSAGALAQRSDDSRGSVEGRPSATERQNGVLSPAPALKNTPSEALVEGRGSEGEGGDPSVAARPLPQWVTMVPLSASRRADSFLTEDEEEAKKGSGQVIDSGESSVDGRPPGPGRHNGVSSPIQGTPGAAVLGVAGLDPSHPTFSPNREVRLQPVPQGG